MERLFLRRLPATQTLGQVPMTIGFALISELAADDAVKSRYLGI